MPSSPKQPQSTAQEARRHEILRQIARQTSGPALETKRRRRRRERRLRELLDQLHDLEAGTSGQDPEA